MVVIDGVSIIFCFEGYRMLPVVVFPFFSVIKFHFLSKKIFLHNSRLGQDKGKL